MGTARSRSRRIPAITIQLQGKVEEALKQMKQKNNEKTKADVLEAYGALKEDIRKFVPNKAIQTVLVNFEQDMREAGIEPPV